MNTQLGKDGIVKLLFKLAIPAMLAQFVNVCYSIVDRIYISNIEGIGAAALAGVGICAPIITFITSFAFLVGMGGAPIMAMRMGAQKNDKAREVLSNSLVLLIGLSVLLTIIIIIFKKPMLMAFGASETTYVHANDYFKVYMYGTIFALLSLGLNSFITAQGFSKTSMVTVLVGAALNIVLDPLFIFTFKMGVSGAAIATVIAQAASCLISILFLLSRKSIIRLSFYNLSFKAMRQICKLGLSPFLIIGTDSVVIIIFNMVLKAYGGVAFGDFYITAGTITMSFMQIITMPLSGISGGCQPILSYNYGAGDTLRVKKAFLGVNIFCVAFSLIMTVVANILPSHFVGIFTRDPAIAEMAIWGIKVYTFGIIFMAIQYACVDNLTALGQSGVAITLSFTRKIIVLITLTIVLPIFLGAKGAFYAEPIADIIGATISGTVSLLLLNKILKKPSKLLG